MKTHILKTWKEHFENVYSDKKTFELRENDRDFQVGDILYLKEYDPNDNTYSGREIHALITHILPLKNFFKCTDTEDFVILSIKKCQVSSTEWVKNHKTPTDFDI